MTRSFADCELVDSGFAGCLGAVVSLVTVVDRKDLIGVELAQGSDLRIGELDSRWDHWHCSQPGAAGMLVVELRDSAAGTDFDTGPETEVAGMVTEPGCTEPGRHQLGSIRLAGHRNCSEFVRPRTRWQPERLGRLTEGRSRGCREDTLVGGGVVAIVIVSTSSHSTEVEVELLFRIHLGIRSVSRWLFPIVVVRLKDSPEGQQSITVADGWR